jgi:hypothetical protein
MPSRWDPKSIRRWLAIPLGLAVGASVGLAGPASAATNTKNDADCVITAYQPVVLSGPSVSAEGRVQCDTRHVITITVQLQINKGGSWNTSKKVTDTVKGAYGIDRSASNACARGTNAYRTRVVATIDQRASVSVASTSPYTACVNNSP